MGLDIVYSGNTDGDRNMGWDRERRLLTPESSPITHAIIGCAQKVVNVLGAGFLESVYEKALAHEIGKAGLVVESQVPIPVYYDEIAIGKFVADLLVQREILVELKSAKALEAAHTAQCINYLKATRLKLCLLINFTNILEVKRITY